MNVDQQAGVVMADSKDNVVSSALVDAVRKVKIAAAERSDVVVDMKEADRARLEILAQKLKPVFDEVPLDDLRFDFAISSGLQPRLWIDATAHVIMGRDRRMYRFVRDTRMGRVTLAEGTDPEPIADAVTTYIAERLLERQQAFAADDMRDLRQPVKHAEESEKAEDDRHSSVQSAEVRKTQSSAVMSKAERSSQTGASAAGLWLLGLFIGGGALLLIFRDAVFASLQ